MKNSLKLESSGLGNEISWILLSGHIRNLAIGLLKVRLYVTYTVCHEDGEILVGVDPSKNTR